MRKLKQWIKANFPGILYRVPLSPASKEQAHKHMGRLRDHPPARLADAAYDVFTYHGEDGILLYLLDQLEQVPLYFVDIGAGDCIKSNCANLAVHENWQGLFIDQDKDQLNIGRKFYRQKKIKAGALDFTQASVTPQNINALLQSAAVPENMGLLSIDIDGNDYWIWKAITFIRPGIVVIEAKVEFGLHNVVVPYGEHNHHSVDQRFNGASVEALRLLGKEKGYKLVGANKPGYNLFFVQDRELLPEARTEDVLQDPGTKASVYPESFFASHTFAD